MNTASGGPPGFRVDVDQNPYLPVGGTEVHAIVTVAAGSGSPPPGAGPAGGGPPPAAEVVIIDGSGSMYGEKIVAAKRAARAAVDALRDGVHFGIVCGTGVARLVYPAEPRLVPADARTRAAAKEAVGSLDASGGTRMGTWLTLADELFAPFGAGALKHAVLLTDGQNNEQTEGFERILARCSGRFVCDCRGVGTDWNVDELRRIASALLGDVGFIRDPDRMAEDFRALTERAMGKSVADVALRLWAPKAARVRFVKQVAPGVEDLTGRAAAGGPQTADYPLGSWGEESREYHLCIEVPAGAPGQQMRAGWVKLVAPSAGGAVLASGNVLAEWTEDEAKATEINARVAHYTGQVELSRAIQEGLRARREGDDESATVRLGRAVALAHASGNRATAEMLGRVVDVVDPATGTVRLKKEVEKADEMTLDTYSTRTVRTRGAGESAKGE
ncbi:vWA domain-containing protein [Nocardiopsis potens]|uniref:vWA domain-containing protein n=1 Tax=Nocardiopsis potens TaxID=1246458 RepID=UPI000344B228|nr:VWA domain-containing protein [Nocardiopsis potens]